MDLAWTFVLSGRMKAVHTSECEWKRMGVLTVLFFIHGWLVCLINRGKQCTSLHSENRVANALNFSGWGTVHAVIFSDFYTTLCPKHQRTELMHVYTFMHAFGVVNMNPKEHGSHRWESQRGPDGQLLSHIDSGRSR